MKTRLLAFSLSALFALTLGACSSESGDPASTPSVAIAPGQAYDAVAKDAKGFTAGALMGANAVYVLFDPQCPHCSHLWEASMPLHSKVKFIWAPVSLLGAKSLPQGAALLQAANPVDAMTAHEKSLLGGQGGMAASASIPADIEASIKANTNLLDSLGASSVPYIVAKNARTGQVVTQAGSMDTQALAELLGVSAN
ncbi:thiol:disulfide interchange protein [Hydrogenophaga crassostreae]|uniref:Thiol:disulfide interchange protein n=1 Tax=Hydrogenophaga crassostreae TaxID=1763535 RepID=A0A162SZ57_9BURK|nr:thioredoxin fold domain-containing protein [Hydrogenophaga crassostreae]AOW15688.1 thiol:disulfide interchange protein [Hydrogenophaga crassostreae]OAD44323.1 thiol:disulfide interchange protein [Hydrogenophaga crassostreae]